MNKKHTMKRLITGLFITALMLTFFSCKDDNSQEKLRANELRLLDEYIDQHYPGEMPKSSGLYYSKVVEGKADSLIRQGDRVEIFYSIWKLDSTLVYETRGYAAGHRYEPSDMIVLPPTQLSPNISSLTELKGLHEALSYMKVGGVSNLVIPSQLGFGQNGGFGVGGFNSLLMQVEVYKVYPAN